MQWVANAQRSLRSLQMPLWGEDLGQGWVCVPPLPYLEQGPSYLSIGGIRLTIHVVEIPKVPSTARILLWLN